jgi:hypothetical protein
MNIFQDIRNLIGGVGKTANRVASSQPVRSYLNFSRQTQPQRIIPQFAQQTQRIATPVLQNYLNLARNTTPQRIVPQAIRQITPPALQFGANIQNLVPRQIQQPIQQATKNYANFAYNTRPQAVISQANRFITPADTQVTTREKQKLNFPDYEQSAPGQPLRADLNLKNNSKSKKKFDIVFHLVSPDGKDISIPQTVEELAPGKTQPYGLEMKIPSNVTPGKYQVYASVNGKEVSGSRKNHQIINAQPVNRYSGQQNETTQPKKQSLLDKYLDYSYKNRPTTTPIISAGKEALGNLANQTRQTIKIAQNRPVTPWNMTKTGLAMTQNITSAPFEFVSKDIENTLNTNPLIRNLGVNTPLGRITAPAALGFAGSVAIPMGSANKISKIAKLTNVEKIATELRGLKIAEKEIPALSKKLVNIKNVDEVTNVIKGHLAQATKGVPKELEPLAQEGKYKFSFLRNTEKAPQPVKGLEDQFAQRIEPKGQYLNIGPQSQIADTAKYLQSKGAKNMETGIVEFKKPLIVEYKSTGPQGWKADVSNMFGDKKGQALTDAIKKSGYDGIITMDKGTPAEVVNLSGQIGSATKGVEGVTKKSSKLLPQVSQGKLQSRLPIQSGQEGAASLNTTLSTPLQSSESVLRPSNEVPLNSSLRKIITQKPGSTVIKERQLVTRMKSSEKFSPDLRQALEGTYIPQSNVETVSMAKRLVRADPKLAETRALSPQNVVDQAIGEELFSYHMNKGDVARANKVLNATSGTNEGQMIQILARYDKTSPSGAVKFAQSKVNEYNKLNPNKPLNLSDEKIKDLFDRATKIQNLPDGRERNIASNQLMEEVNKLIPTSILDKAVTVWKAGLLTSLRTHERNILGSIFHGGAEILKDIPASAVDVLMGAKTGKRSTTFTLKGIGSGFKKGLKAGKNIVTTGFDPEESINKYDFKAINWGNNPVEQTLKKYTNTVFRALGGADKPFWNAGFSRSMYNQAGAEAINAGKAGDRIFIENLVKNPTTQMIEVALKDADVTTFKNRNTLGQIASGIKQKAGPLGEVVAPFTGVPSSIAGQLVAYSPIGLLKGSANTIKVLAGKTPELQRQAAQEVGRGVVGSAIMSIAALLAAKGLITGQPKDQAETRQWELEGKQANSIKIGGKWRAIGSIGPEALIALAGSKIQASDDVMQAAGNIGKDFLSQTFLSGVQQPLNVITDPARYAGTYIPSQIASTIPNMVKDIAKSFDPNQRETYVSKDIPQSVLNSLKSGTPGLRNTLLPKRNVLGQPLQNEQSGISAFIDLFNSKTPVNDTLINELSRLNTVGFNTTPSKLTPNQTINGQKVTLSPSELNNLEIGSGQLLQQNLTSLVNEPYYQSLNDELKSKAIDKVVQDTRTQYKNSNADTIGGTSTGQTTTSTTSTKKITLKQPKKAKKLTLKKGKKGKVIKAPKLKFAKAKLPKAKLKKYKLAKVKQYKAKGIKGVKQAKLAEKVTYRLRSTA